MLSNQILSDSSEIKKLIFSYIEKKNTFGFIRLTGNLRFDGQGYGLRFLDLQKMVVNKNENKTGGSCNYKNTCSYI